VAVTLLTVCFSLVAAMAMAQGSTPEKAQKVGDGGAVQGKQLCPPAQAPGKGLCTVGGECPTGKSPGQTVGQPSSGCPAAGPAKTGEEKKNK
jgi:hypothetical protein